MAMISGSRFSTNLLNSGQSFFALKRKLLAFHVKNFKGSLLSPFSEEISAVSSPSLTEEKGEEAETLAFLEEPSFSTGLKNLFISEKGRILYSKTRILAVFWSFLRSSTLYDEQRLDCTNVYDYVSTFLVVNTGTVLWACLGVSFFTKYFSYKFFNNFSYRNPKKLIKFFNLHTLKYLIHKKLLSFFFFLPHPIHYTFIAPTTFAAVSGTGVPKFFFLPFSLPLSSPPLLGQTPPTYAAAAVTFLLL